jgi:hypothetical protein
MAVDKKDKATQPPPKKSLLVTTRERELARSRAQLIKMFSAMEQAKTEAAAARREASELREHIITTSTGKTKINFRTLAATVTAVVMGTAVLKVAYVGYIHSQEPAKIVAPFAMAPISAAPVPSLAVRRAAETPLPLPHVQQKDQSSSPEDIQFALAVDRLQDAFNSLPESQSEIVKMVNQKNPGGPLACPLAWNNGQASLYLGGGKGSDPLSLAAAMNQCADATEKLRAEREALLRAHEDTSGH